MSVNHVKFRTGVAALFSFFFILLSFSPVHPAEGIVWERVRLVPLIVLSEKYSDNIFLTHGDRQSDFVTAVEPGASLEFALVPQNSISLRYGGDYRFYQHADNFKTSLHQSGLSWTVTAPKGSTFKVDAGEDHNSIQPYSRTDSHKDYVERTFSAEAGLKSMTFADLGFRYDHASRRFKDPLYDLDDSTRDAGTANMTYWALPSTGFLAEYTFSHQRNHNLPVAPVMNTQIVLGGITWSPTAKASGHAKAGYYFTKLQGAGNSRGFDMDTDLAYQASEMTRLSLAAFRRLVRSTILDRETGAFYISTGGKGSLSYRRWDPVTFILDAVFVNNVFQQNVLLPGAERRDRAFSTGLAVKYSQQDRLAVTLEYRHRFNDSDNTAYTFRENAAEARLSASI